MSEAQRQLIVVKSCAEQTSPAYGHVHWRYHAVNPRIRYELCLNDEFHSYTQQCPVSSVLTTRVISRHNSATRARRTSFGQ